MATVYVIRHRGSDGERRAEDLRRGREAHLLDGLRKTGRVLDGWRQPYQGQREELRGIQNRINRIKRGEEKVK